MVPYRAERAFRQPALPTGVNCNGGFFHNGWLSNSDKVLFIVAGKALGWSNRRVARHTFVRCDKETVRRLWRKFVLTGELGALRKGRRGSAHSRTMLHTERRLYIRLWLIRCV